jgi:hypothetical protein
MRLINRKSKLIKDIKRVAGITLLTDSIMFNTNVAGSKEYTKYDNHTYVTQTDIVNNENENGNVAKAKNKLLTKLDEISKKDTYTTQEFTDLYTNISEYAGKSGRTWKKLKKLCEEGKEHLNELLQGCLDGDKDFCEAYEREFKD